MRLRVLIPVAAVTMLVLPVAASAAFPHVVAPGESLSSIASTDGLTVEELAAANGLSPEAPLIAGSTLMIPAVGSGNGASEGTSAEESSAGTEDDGSSGGSSNGGSYLVQPGDTLSEIAARAGTATDELAAANGIGANETLLSGTVLRVPVAATETGQSGESATEVSSSAAPYPTEETVTASEVGSIAAENGVPPSLAEAIADQESGFNNGVTSSANARGVMQILPETWSYVGQQLAPTPLAPASASDNVRAGVLLLHSLLNETGGDPALAAAGYYQGLSSVRQNGVEPETEQYVSSVLSLQRQFGGE
jgi:LysM repeat protein